MSILFIYSVDEIYSFHKPLSEPGQIQFGISYISAFLKRYLHQTKLVVLSRILGRKNYRIIDEYLKKNYPRLICFTAVSSEYRFIADIAKYIKNSYPGIYLLIGGPHVSLNPQDILCDEFDALCIGEGEHPALELVSQLEKGMPPSGIPNLWIKKDSQIEKNPTRPFLQDLDSLPFPDREMWQEWIIEGSGLRHMVLLGRGCPYECTYCCNHALKKISSGTYLRFRSSDNVAEEIKEIVTKYPMVEEIYLEVETIGINKKWDIELCLKLKQLNAALSKPLTFGVNLRVTANAELESLFAAFKESNFRFINIGLESGSERVRREILKRNYSNEDIIAAVRLARKYGLRVNFYNLIGVPGETAADFQETLKMNRKCMPDFCYNYIFYPYPGTLLYSLCKEKGLLKRCPDIEMERSKATLDLPGFRKKQIQKSYLWFDYCFYKGYKPEYKLLASVLALKVRSNYFYRRIKHYRFFQQLRRILKGLYSIQDYKKLRPAFGGAQGLFLAKFQWLGKLYTFLYRKK